MTRNKALPPLAISIDSRIRVLSANKHFLEMRATKDSLINARERKKALASTEKEIADDLKEFRKIKPKIRNIFSGYDLTSLNDEEFELKNSLGDYTAEKKLYNIIIKENKNSVNEKEDDFRAISVKQEI